MFNEKEEIEGYLEALNMKVLIEGMDCMDFEIEKDY